MFQFLSAEFYINNFSIFYRDYFILQTLPLIASIPVNANYFILLFRSLIIDYQNMKQTRFSRKSNEAVLYNLKDLQDQQRLEQYQSFTSQLKGILEVLNSEKQALLTKVASEKEQLMKTIYNHQYSIEQFKTDNELLRQENFQLRSQLQQKRVVIEYLKKKSRKTELENNSLTSILQYLEAKNRELTQELFALTQGNTNRQQLKTQPKTSKKRACVIDRESLLQYTDFDQKDIKPLQLIKVSSYPMNSILNGLNEESQRNTVQKGKQKDDQKISSQIQRVRSVGVIAKTGRQPTARNQMTANRKRNSITKSFISHLIEQQKSKKAKIKSHGNDSSTKNSEKISS